MTHLRLQGVGVTSSAHERATPPSPPRSGRVALRPRPTAALAGDAAPPRSADRPATGPVPPPGGPALPHASPAGSATTAPPPARPQGEPTKHSAPVPTTVRGPRRVPPRSTCAPRRSG